MRIVYDLWSHLSDLAEDIIQLRSVEKVMGTGAKHCNELENLRIAKEFSNIAEYAGAFVVKLHHIDHGVIEVTICMDTFSRAETIDQYHKRALQSQNHDVTELPDYQISSLFYQQNEFWVESYSGVPIKLGVSREVRK